MSLPLIITPKAEGDLAEGKATYSIPMEAKGGLTMACSTRSQGVAVCAIAVMAFVALSSSLRVYGAEIKEQASAGKPEPRGKATETAGQPERINVDALQFVANGRPVSNRSSEAAGFVLIAEGAGPQCAVLAHAGAVVTCVRQDETAAVTIPLPKRSGAFSVSARVDLLAGEAAQVEMAVAGKNRAHPLRRGQETDLRLNAEASGGGPLVCLIARSSGEEVAVRWREIRIETEGGSRTITLAVQDKKVSCPPPKHPPLRPALEQVLIEWDWRMQDGIGTPRDSVSYAAAIEQTFKRGDLLIEDLHSSGQRMAAERAAWDNLRLKRERLAADKRSAESAWEGLWREVHQVRRRIALKNPLAETGPLVFVQDVPGGAYSSHIVSFHGDSARPGGGVFVLEEPGRSMRVRPLVRDQLPQGAYMHPEVSYDGRQILFAYAKVDSDPTSYGEFPNRHFHLYSVDADGSPLKQLTDGPYDDHSPCVLPSGKIIFISTRRGGFHRCGKGPCPTHTLAVCEADGSDARVVSFHETHEYDPAVLHDGRVLYTRWDYVDRPATLYQHLWTVKPDGSDVRIYYGNSTVNPMGIWEALPIPGSKRVMGIACAHHAMPAGSIVLVDVSKGTDGLEPLTRFTPDVPFYESEFPVQSRWGGRWPPDVQKRLHTIRWPGHCYRSPYPLSEKYCLAAYTFDILRGEPYFNPPHLFGLYLVDRFGNKELLYRDLNISSSWPIPLRPREKPPILPSTLASDGKEEGTFLLQNVYASWTPLTTERVTHLRVIQVLPKTTPHSGNPPPGAARAAPGKQVLGTVPVV
jgi:hypothetical protein